MPTHVKAPKCPASFYDGKIIDPAVDHPPHYTAGAVECIDAIEAALTKEQFIGYCKGNVLKYTWRSGRKERGTHKQDLEKARWYVDRCLSSLPKKFRAHRQDLEEIRWYIDRCLSSLSNEQAP